MITINDSFHNLLFVEGTVFHFLAQKSGILFLIDQWLKGGRCDISTELMSIGFSRLKYNGHFENHG